jgi:rubredoxin
MPWDIPIIVEGLELPQHVVCHECGCVLYEGDELKPPDEILHKHNGKCPKCGRKLAFIPLNVEVKPVK